MRDEETAAALQLVGEALRGHLARKILGPLASMPVTLGPLRAIDGQVRVEPSGIIISAEYPAKLLARQAPDAIAKTALFVLHELTHGRQGVATLAQVRCLRDAGGETELLEIDLAADHTAARLLAAARPTDPGFTLGQLKRIQTESLLDFPAGATHTPEAVERKSLRLISLRTDFLLRHYHIARPRGYAACRATRGGFIVLIRGLSAALLALSPISEPEFHALTQAACIDASDRDSALDALDGMILRLLRVSSSASRDMALAAE